MNLRLLFILIFVIICINCAHSNKNVREAEVMRAYSQVTNSALFPKDLTPEESKSMTIILNNQDIIARHLIKRFSQAEKFTNYKEKAIFGSLSLDVRLKIARTLIQNGVEKRFFLFYLAYYGKEEDMKNLKQEIIKSPDSKWSTGLARGLLGSMNTHAHDLLIDMEKTVPGKWLTKTIKVRLIKIKRKRDEKK